MSKKLPILFRRVIIYETSRRNADACLQFIDNVTRIEVNGESVSFHDKDGDRLYVPDYAAKVELIP